MTTKPTISDWRAQAEKELGGVSFEKALVHTTPEGLAVEPLYVERPTSMDRAGTGPTKPLRVCMHVDPAEGRRNGAVREDVDGGADALWFDARDDESLDAGVKANLDLVIDVGTSTPPDVIAWLATRELGDRRVWIGIDPITAAARGVSPIASLPDRLPKLAALVKDATRKLPGARVLRVSTLTFHSAGAEAAEEIALALTAGVAYLRALVEGGFTAEAAASALWFQIAVGRDTFGELCKLRALRRCWTRLVGAIGAPDTTLPAIHAVTSPRTQTTLDSAVNMLRVTTQVFAAALGGADLVTPHAFDDVGSRPTALGRRVARNTALVLRDESHLGKVADPAGGSYFFESFTDALAREAWRRFQESEKSGGIVSGLINGTLSARLDASWQHHEARIADGELPILGVTEFRDAGTVGAVPPLAQSTTGLPEQRDSESFEVAK